MNASSESGLWATVISRTADADALLRLMQPFSSPDEATMRPSLDLIRYALGLQPGSAPEANRQRGSCHDFNHFGKDEPVEPKPDGQAPGMGQRRQPAQSSHEQQDFSQYRGDGRAAEPAFAMLHDPARQPGNEGIGQQESARGSQHLRDAAQAGRVEHRQSDSPFRQVQRQGSKAATATQGQTNQQDAEVLQGQGNRG